MLECVMAAGCATRLSTPPSDSARNPAISTIARSPSCRATANARRAIPCRLSVGYSKAASLVERMEREGIVGAPNHSGKRAILVGGGIDRATAPDQ
jgi:DNA segregation ATPase FtsK/SpoIIIE-like protein